MFLGKNRGIKSMFIIRNILNENNLDDYFHYNLTPRELAKFNKANSGSV